MSYNTCNNYVPTEPLGAILVFFSGLNSQKSIWIGFLQSSPFPINKYLVTNSHFLPNVESEISFRLGNYFYGFNVV